MRTVSLLSSSRRRLLGGALLLALGAAGPLGAAIAPAAQAADSGQFIVQASSASVAGSLVTSVGGTVQSSLPLVNGVLASLSASAQSTLASTSGVRVTADATVYATVDSTATSTAPSADVFPTTTGAANLAASGNNGGGVTVAVLDTGIDPRPDFGSRLIGGVDLTGEGNPFQDDYGHGTFVAGLVAGDGSASAGAYPGEATGANLVAIKVAGASGLTDLATVISGVSWAVDHQSAYGIRVLNMSLGAVPVGPTQFNPLDQAVEAAWRAGIVVVTSAGNSGPGAGTITAPGDDPYVITAGALADAGTTTTSDDTVPAFSSEGPTTSDGWIKPDLVAAGQSVVSLRAPGSTIDTSYSSARVGSQYFVGSGTSFSAPITAGAAALVLAAHPSAAPDEVKARLLTTTTAGPSANPFIEGHGDLNAYGAVQVAPLSLLQNPYSLPTASLGQVIALSTVWAVSSFDAVNYSGPGTAPSVWTSQAWTSQAWTSQAWTSQAWTSQAWTSQAWTSQAWTSQAWTSGSWS